MSYFEIHVTKNWKIFKNLLSEECSKLNLECLWITCENIIVSVTFNYSVFLLYVASLDLPYVAMSLP